MIVIHLNPIYFSQDLSAIYSAVFSAEKFLQNIAQAVDTGGKGSEQSSDFIDNEGIFLYSKFIFSGTSVVFRFVASPCLV